MRAGCLLAICGDIRQLKERKWINHSRPKRRQAWGLRARTCGAAATGAWAARNTMRLRRGIESTSNVCG